MPKFLCRKKKPPQAGRGEKVQRTFTGTLIRMMSDVRAINFPLRMNKLGQAVLQM